MKPYVITTGTVFGLIVVAHIWRAVVEGPGIAKDRPTSFSPSWPRGSVCGRGAC